MRDHVQDYASQTREEWKAELLGEMDEDGDEDKEMDE